MALFHNSAITGASGNQGGGYQISRSLRFNSADSAYLSRTPASAGNRKTWTFSFWAKRSNIVARQILLETRAALNDTDYFSIEFTIDTTAPRIAYGGANTTWGLTRQVFRDVSAWYHIVLAVDTTQSTANNRIKLYVNGSQVTNFDIEAYPAQNADTGINAASLTTIGSGTTGSSFYSGYLADIHFIDGQALTPSSFGETNATTGQWVPKAYTGTYGTNGFRLDFSDNSAATATTLGKDRAGSNNWTPNNLSVTAGAGNDSLVDTPTSYGTDTGAGGEVRGNYCTWNPLDILATALSDGNLKASGSTVVAGVSGSIGVASGKYYWEITAGSVYDVVGIWSVNSRVSGYPGGTSDSYGYFASSGNKFNSGNQSSYGSSYASGDVIGIALDLNAGSLAFYKNGTSQGTAFTGLSGGFRPAVRAGNDSAASTTHANFGQRPFAYTAPSGFKALCDTNLPAPTIAKPSTVFNTVIWTGNGTTGTGSITGVGFQPDFVWSKIRSGSGSFNLNNSIVGGGSNKSLASNNTDSEASHNSNSTFGYLSSFDSDGFSYFGGSTPYYYSGNGNAYVAWCWDAGSSTVTNTQGSITSQVRANASAGFSIVTFTGNGSSGATVGHGLGITPSMIIVKRRNSTGDWWVWQSYLASLNANNTLRLNSTDAATASFGVFGSVTSSLFTTAGGLDINTNTATYVAYCFAPVTGYSSFGSYTGNGSADGPFVYTGFRPRFLLMKNSNVSGQYWDILDTARDTYNASGLRLFPNASDAENDVRPSLDILSNGFKIRNNYTSTNGNTNVIIYAAFAESPFAYSRAR